MRAGGSGPLSRERTPSVMLLGLARAAGRLAGRAGYGLARRIGLHPWLHSAVAGATSGRPRAHRFPFSRVPKGYASQTVNPPSSPDVVAAPVPAPVHHPRLSEEDRRIDDATVADFVARHGAPTFAPVTVVIPSYGEAANIEAVLNEIPREMLGMGTSAVVVVDGRHPSEEEGATARRVEGTGHHVAVAPVNRGQGAALRVAYRLAREGGARYIVSLDADGQYNPADIPALLEPIVSGDADFVPGSR